MLLGSALLAKDEDEDEDEDEGDGDNDRTGLESLHHGNARFAEASQSLT
jgi:hypothetical protein